MSRWRPDPRKVCSYYTKHLVALGVVMSLRLAFFGVRASWIAVVGGDPRTLLLRCARPGRRLVFEKDL
jgi:hypothetical protein